MARSLVAGLALLLVVLCAEASAQLLECRGGHKPSQVAELMFGRTVGSRLAVSEGAWSLFVEREITPRFPDGFTVLDARGQWRNPASNRIIRQPSKIVRIVLPGNPEDVARLNEIVEAYKVRFKQQSVGVMMQGACASF